jgi:hypothetical protein
MEEKNQNISILQFLKAFFPIQLLIAHLKNNLLALSYWVILFLIVTDNIGSAFGIPLLFLSPEYLDEVSGLAFFLIGFSIGGFTMGFNTYSYIKIGTQFHFLLVVKKPFLKFCLNNSILPVLFSILYMYKVASFQHKEEFASANDIITYILSYIGGIIVFMLLSLLYFFPRKNNKIEPKSEYNFTRKKISLVNKKTKWFTDYNPEDEKLSIYIGRRLKLYNSRSVRHLDIALKEKVFSSNKVNTSIFELITIVFFISIGLFREFDLFEFPAAMSVVLLFTVILMLFSALISWLHRWTYPILILIIMTMNYLSVNSNFFTYKNFAYGLSYEKESKDKYSIDVIKKITSAKGDDTRTKYIKILENWKVKTGQEKPKLILSISSGGGSRSALWTLTVLQKTDEVLKGNLSKHLHLMTGASGGMVGAAYYREILLRYKKGEFRSMYSGDFRENIAKDLLNKLCFSASTNDLLFRYQSFEKNGHIYTKDRGYAFEQQLNDNTNDFLDHNLGYYKSYESDATIPIMIFTPTIVNDGRRLFMSSQSLRFMTNSPGGPNSLMMSYENLDYQTLFKTNKPNDIRFTSVLRAQATFPFILPMVTMPTNPGVQLMDAGIRDNYGTKTMIEFLDVMKDWIAQNTSGVIILQIRDTKKVLNKETYNKVSLLDKVSLPFSNMYKNFTRTQDFDQEELLKVGANNFKVPVDIITFNLRENKNDRISLSWHLTKNEKQKIERAFRSTQNQLSVRKLEILLQ